MQLLKSTLAILLAAPVFGAETNPAPAEVVAHEWGTFTSVADANGEAAWWLPFSGTAELPCFVHRLGPFNPKAAPTKIRMETPVVYFYTQRKTTVSVHADFPKGLITEWYPQATVAPGKIDWNVELTPGEKPELSTSQSASHYFAARETDGAPLRGGTEQEKMLFYRGVGDFAVPVAPVFARDGRLEIHSREQEPIPVVILFENRGGKLGFRIARDVRGNITLNMPEVTAAAAEVKQQLAGALTSAGLYPKEAAAMIATWNDSWFEEGTRLFYIAPRSLVDQVLPLKISPAPQRLERVFVGRVELMPAYLKDTLETALQSSDVQTLDRFGRFLQPFVAMIDGPTPAAKPRRTQQYLDAKFAAALMEYSHPSCAK